MKVMKRILSLVVVLALVFSVSGCSKIKDKMAEKAADTILGPNVDVKDGEVEIKGDDGSSLKTGSDLEWPKDGLGDLPKLKGRVETVMNIGTGQLIGLKEVDRDDYSEYVEKLKGMGYEQTFAMQDENTLSFMGSKEETKETVSVSYTVADEYVSITYNKEEPQE